MRIAPFLHYGVLGATALAFSLYWAISAAVSVSSVVHLICPYGIATCFAMWACLDARTRRSTPCFDFGTFVFFTWPFAVPGYLIATRGWRGLLMVLSAAIAIFLVAVGVAFALLVGNVG